jgi:hypothetical protein
MATASIFFDHNLFEHSKKLCRRLGTLSELG